MERACQHVYSMSMFWYKGGKFPPVGPSPKITGSKACVSCRPPWYPSAGTEAPAAGAPCTHVVSPFSYLKEAQGVLSEGLQGSKVRYKSTPCSKMNC